MTRLKPLFHSSRKQTRKLAASAFKYYDWMKVLAASLRVGFCGECKTGFRFSPYGIKHQMANKNSLSNSSNMAAAMVQLAHKIISVSSSFSFS